MISKPRAALAVFLLLAVSAYSADLSSNDLIEGGKRYDGKEIVYSGEAIGDPMHRGNHWWVNLNDGNNAIGIWLDERQFAALRAFGSYNATGDVLRIRGTFHRSCTEHGGDMDVHAVEITIVKRGWSTAHEVKGSSALLAAALLVTALVVFLAWRRRDKH